MDQDSHMVKYHSAERASDDTEIDYIARARALRPLIEAAAPRTEAEGEVAADVMDALHEAAMFRLLLPRSFGGAELEPATFVQVVEEIAKADASTAWCVVQNGGTAMMAAYLKPEVAAKIFANPHAVVGS